MCDVRFFLKRFFVHLSFYLAKSPISRIAVRDLKDIVVLTFFPSKYYNTFTARQSIHFAIAFDENRKRNSRRRAASQFCISYARRRNKRETGKTTTRWRGRGNSLSAEPGPGHMFNEIANKISEKQKCVVPGATTDARPFISSRCRGGWIGFCRIPPPRNKAVSAPSIVICTGSQLWARSREACIEDKKKQTGEFGARRAVGLRRDWKFDATRVSRLQWPD